RCDEKAAATRPQAARPANAMTSSLWWMASVRYGFVRKKSRLRAETSAVTSAAARPPSSPMAMVRRTNANARLDAVVTSRSGVSAPPRAMAAIPPLAMWKRLSSRVSTVVVAMGRLPGRGHGRRTAEALVQLEVQEEDVHPGLAQEAEGPSLHARLHDRPHVCGRHPPGLRHPRNLPAGRVRADVGIEAARGRRD